MSGFLRVYLLTGLVLHKAVWELLKRGQPRAAAKMLSPRVKLVKAVKIVILLGVAVQTLAPDILPIAGDAGTLRYVGAAVFTMGLAIALAARFQLGRNWLDIEAAGVLARQSVVCSGVYRYIRHPIYVGDLLLLTGLELAANSWLVVVALGLIPVVLRQAVREERILDQKLPGYREYCRQSKRFIPFVA